MNTERTYLNSHKRLGAIVLCLGIGLASLSLFYGITWHFLIFHGDDNYLVLASTIIFALFVDLALARMLAAPSQQPYAQALIKVTGAIAAGTTLISILIWREHSLEIVRFIFRVP